MQKREIRGLAEKTSKAKFCLDLVISNVEIDMRKSPKDYSKCSELSKKFEIRQIPNHLNILFGQNLGLFQFMSIRMSRTFSHHKCELDPIK